MSGLKIGVDEAGRGPVIGPLVVCALCIPDEDESVLRELGARDSKELSPAERRDISEKILSEAESSGWGVGIVICEAERIDSNSQYSDLNKLEIELLRRDSQALPEIVVRDVELDLKYLMGRNYHRGQDGDLGPYELSGM